MSSGLHGREVAARIVEERKPVMVAGGEHGVLLAGCFGEGGPCVRIELIRVELPREPGIFIHGDLLVPLNPLTTAGDGIDAPMHEETELGVSPPCNARCCIIVSDKGRPLCTRARCRTKDSQ